VFDGTRYRINAEPDWTDPAAYFQLQRRFRNGDLDLEGTRQAARARFERPRAMAEAFPA
jgi:hypothetical protein